MAVSRFGLIAIGLVATLPTCGEVQGSSAEALIGVSVYNYAQIPEVELASAKHTASRVFLRAGVEIVWSNIPTSGWAEVALRHSGRWLGASDLRLRILPRAKVPKWAKKSRCIAFSLLPENGGFGTIVNIYCERILAIARRENRPAGFVLGYVVAHEIGHLLLRKKGHSRSGIMSFPITGQYLSQASLGRLVFTQSQKKRLQREARTRIRWDREIAEPTEQIAGTQVQTGTEY